MQSYTNFFRLVTQDNKNNKQVWVSKYPRRTMVLFSRQTATPLAAFIVTSRDVGCPVVVTQRPSPESSTKPHFQAVFQWADQTMDITLVNFTDSYLAFNVLEGQERINEINAVQPKQCYTIAADRRCGKELVLSGLTEKKGDGTEKKVTVGEAEAGPINRGLCFHLSVTPQSHSIAALQFAETIIWKVSPLVILPLEASKVSNFSEGFALSDWEDDYIYSAPVFRSLDIPDSDFDNFGVENPPPLDLCCINVGGLNREEKSAQHGDSLFEASALNIQQAGKLTHGMDITVKSHACDLTFDYEHKSSPTVVCFSIAPDLQLFPQTQEQLMNQAKAELDEFVKTQGRVFLDRLNAVYKADQCVIDLDGEPDTVLCNCGHLCIKHVHVDALLKTGFGPKCPVCREAIVAMVRTNGIVEWGALN